ncbi:MAG TPA: CoA-disulfide reductase [Negativicutes bacterium]|nr:CoA-disulfide reductase [Negativicutes bacterium]
MGKKVLIVGGVAGGASAAARLRRLKEDYEIVMFEKGEYISFANCGLPYYIGGTIADRSKLIVQTVEAMADRFNIDVRVSSEVEKIDRTNKTVSVRDLKSGRTYDEGYDILVLSPGASPIRPPIPGIEEAASLFTLRSIPDTDAIKKFVDENNPKHAVVVGGGFIGLEMAENLRERSVKVTLVEMADQVMAPLDYEMAAIVHDHLADKDVELILQDGVKAFNDKGRTVVLNSGREIATDMVILAIGVQPETKIAKDAGLDVNARGAIIVDSRMKTSDPAIYALGDAVEVTDYINCKPTMIPLAWPANRQGRIVADNIAGRDVGYPGTLGSSVAKVFDLTVAATGNSEKVLKRMGIDYQVLHIHPGSHASYYPGAFPMSLKLLFTPQEGKILGAQAVGFDGVEKRVDVLATAIKGKLTVFDLPDLELCYAPPYSSAKDPVNMAGYLAENIIEGLVDTVQWHEVDGIAARGGLFVDVRDPFELALGKLDNSVNIPLGQLRKRAGELPKDEEIYVYCQVGLRGYIACRMLTQLGYKCKNVDGGYKTYALVKGINGDKGEKIWHTTQDNGVSEVMTVSDKIAVKIDACGLQCPGPIRRVFEEMGKLQEGEILEVSASDPGFKKDIASWCDKTGNTLLKGEFDNQAKKFVALIRKGRAEAAEAKLAGAGKKEGATLVVFSGDLDKAIASFIIATGAASMGKQVTMFFTFWGLNIIKRKDKPLVVKDTIARMFDVMLPGHAGALPLSQMNMAGMGPMMIKHIMAKNNVDSIETLIKNAINMGVKVVACSMSMDLMGIKQEEFIDGVEVGGVASYLAATEDAGLNLFI